jgi:hypothetical protein
VIIELTGLNKRLDLNVEIHGEEELKPIVPEEAFTITGDCSYRFANGGWDWFIEDFGDRVITDNITNTRDMFKGVKVSKIPFDINLGKDVDDVDEMFADCLMETLPDINGDKVYKKGLYSFFNGCAHLNQPITLDWFKWYNFEASHNTTGYTAPDLNYLFNKCHSLRVIEEKLLKELWSNYPSHSSQLFTSGFAACYSLDELKGLYPPPISSTSNIFNNSFTENSRIKELIFALDDNGNPHIRNWSNQTISLTQWVGWGHYKQIKTHLQYSKLTDDTEIKDDATYQALKNNPDSWTEDVNYSRYNKRSALNTIKSLPDVSQGKSNKIVFQGNAGSLTDEGAINTLTEEEIAIATVKGWTVAF